MIASEAKKPGAYWFKVGAEWKIGMLSFSKDKDPRIPPCPHYTVLGMSWAEPCPPNMELKGPIEKPR